MKLKTQSLAFYRRFQVPLTLGFWLPCQTVEHSSNMKLALSSGPGAQSYFYNSTTLALTKQRSDSEFSNEQKTNYSERYALLSHNTTSRTRMRYTCLSLINKVHHLPKYVAKFWTNSRFVNTAFWKVSGGIWQLVAVHEGAFHAYVSIYIFTQILFLKKVTCFSPSFNRSILRASDFHTSFRRNLAVHEGAFHAYGSI